MVMLHENTAVKAGKLIKSTENNEIRKNATAIQYGYNLNINLYKENGEEEPVRVNPSTVLSSVGMAQTGGNTSQSSMMATTGMPTNTDVWSEMLDNEELLKTQYDIVAGNWPTAYNEVVLIVSENNEITDYTVVGLKDEKGNVGLFIYDLDSGKYTKYQELNFNSNKIFLLDATKIPKGLKETKIKMVVKILIML